MRRVDDLLVLPAGERVRARRADSRHAQRVGQRRSGRPAGAAIVSAASAKVSHRPVLISISERISSPATEPASGPARRRVVHALEAGGHVQARRGSRIANSSSTPIVKSSPSSKDALACLERLQRIGDLRRLTHRPEARYPLRARARPDGEESVGELGGDPQRAGPGPRTAW